MFGVLCRATLVGAAIVMLSGCGAGAVRKYPPHVPVSQIDAGTTTVAVVMIEPWQNVVGDLKPAFSLTGDQAVAKVLPITSAVQDKVLDAFGAGLSVGLPSSTVARTDEIVKADNQSRSTDQKTISRETGPGEAPELSLDPVAGRSAASLPGIDLGASLFEDPPILQYQAALALFQEVKLLNRYVDSAALAHGMVPYLVRLQIGVTPYANREPFDVYSRIAFFSRMDEGDLAQICGRDERCLGVDHAVRLGDAGGRGRSQGEARLARKRSSFRGDGVPSHVDEARSARVERGSSLGAD